MPAPKDWIAATGFRVFNVDAQDTAIPTAVLNDPKLSLIAKGLYALTLSYQGQPVNPYADSFEDVEEIRAAIDELVEAGLVKRAQP